MKLNKQAKVVIATIGITLILGVSWGIYKALIPPPDFSVTIDLSDYEGLTEKYLAPVSSGIAAITWTDPEELDPSSLCVFYFKTQNPHRTDPPYVYVPIDAKEIEGFIKEHFDVSTKHLRKSSYYDAKTSTYWCSGLGSSAGYAVVGAEIVGNKLLLNTEYYSPSDDSVLIRTGVLTIELSENSYKYISSSVINVD